MPARKEGRQQNTSVAGEVSNIKLLWLTAPPCDAVIAAMQEPGVILSPAGPEYLQQHQPGP